MWPHITRWDTIEQPDGSFLARIFLDRYGYSPEPDTMTLVFTASGAEACWRGETRQVPDARTALEVFRAIGAWVPGLPRKDLP